VNGLSTASPLLCPLLILLVPLAPIGLALLNAGLNRSRSAAQALLGSLCVMAVAAVAYSVVGWSLEGFAGGTAHSVSLGGVAWNWIAAQPLMLHGIRWTRPEACAAALQIFTVGMAALIPWGSGAERWRLGSGCAATVLLAGFVYPIFAHWVWGGGWLAQLGSTFHLGYGFMDPGGAATIQMLGGLTALVVVWIVGARRGKFPENSPPAAIPAHHIVYVLFGGMIALAGWFALNAAGAILFVGADPAALARTIVNTMLCACGALLAALVVTRLRFGKPDASLCANGWVAGLAASSAVAALVSPGAALFTGAVAGGLLPLVIEFLEVRCRLDDPSGGIAVHGFAGLWGLLACGFLGRGPQGQFVAQLVGIATLAGLVLPVMYVLYGLLNRIMPFRTHREGERVGMDLHELGAGAYPEFVMHNDEFLPR
jgi:ammonium transporter, Amt family